MLFSFFNLVSWLFLKKGKLESFCGKMFFAHLDVVTRMVRKPKIVINKTWRSLDIYNYAYNTLAVLKLLGKFLQLKSLIVESPKNFKISFAKLHTYIHIAKVQEKFYK